MSGARMKNRKPHDVHLSRPVQAVLRALSEARSKDSRGGKGEICEFVVSTTGKTSISDFSRAKARLDAAINNEARTKAAAAPATEPAPLVPWRLHDLRLTGASTLAGWASTRSLSISFSRTSRRSSGVSSPSTSVTISPRSGRGPWTRGPNTCSPTKPDSRSDRWTPRCSSSQGWIGRLSRIGHRNS